MLPQGVLPGCFISVVRKTSRFFVILREAKDPSITPHSLNVHWPALCKYYFSRGGLKLMQGSFIQNGVVGVEVLPVGSDPIL
jgi:hypothetical protein